MNQSEKKFLIIPTEAIQTDTYLVLHALAVAMSARGVVFVAAAKAQIDKFTSKLPMPENVKLIEELPEQKMLIQFPGQKNNIKSIQWNQDSDQLNIYLTMQEGKFNSEKMQLTPMSEKFDEIIILQANSLSEIGSFGDPKYRYIFEDAKITSVGGKMENELANSSSIQVENSSSISEDGFKYLSNSSSEVSAETATEIFAALLYSTDSLKTEVTNPNTYLTMAELTKLGASSKAANELLNKVRA